MFRRDIFSLLLPVFLTLAGCAVNLPEYHEQGYGIVIFPDNYGSTVWLSGNAVKDSAVQFKDIGGGYTAAVLEPGVYSLSGVYNMEKRSILGRGNKDLDFGDKRRGTALATGEMKSSLGIALVKRLPIKEMRGGGRFDTEHSADISSEYRISLALPESLGPTAWFEVGAGQVLFLPALRGEIKLNEQDCTRKGLATVSYTPYVLSDNPEDFEILEWYCPVDKLTLALVPARLEELKAAADSEKLPPELMSKLKLRELKTGQWLQNAEETGGKRPGQTRYSFSGS